MMMIVVATLIARLISPHLHLVNVVMVYQLTVVIIATRWGRGPSIFSSIVSTLVFDFLFVPPYFSFSVSGYSIPFDPCGDAFDGFDNQCAHFDSQTPG